MPQSSLLRYDIRHIPIDETGLGGASVIFAGTAGIEIYGVNWILVAAQTVVATWRSGTTPIGGAINGGTVGAAPGEAIYAGHWKCEDGDDLQLLVDATIGVTGSVVIALVPVGV